MNLQEENRRTSDTAYKAIMEQLKDNSKILIGVEKEIIVIQAHEKTTASELKKQNGRIEKIEDRVGGVEKEVAVTKVKTGIFATVSGAISGFMATFVKSMST